MSEERKIAAYLRVSLEEGERQTVEGQRTEFDRNCKLRQVPPSEIYKVYAEDISGRTAFAKRSIGKEVLDDARQGKFNELDVYKIDRLGRKASVILNAIEELEKLGVRVRSLTEPFDTATPEGRLMLTILAAVAAFERDTIVGRTGDNSRNLARGGNYMGGTVPYGFRVEGEDRTAHLVLHNELLAGQSFSEVQIVRKLYSLTADGRSCQHIADHLNNTGVPTPRCHLGQRRLWTREMVRRIIINSVYRGQLTYGKRKTFLTEEGKRRFKAMPRDQWIVAQCPSIVGEKLWQQANAALKHNQLTAMAHPKHEYLLSGLIQCGICGRNYIGVGIRYRCNGRHGAKALGVERCTGKTVRRQELEAAVTDDLRSFLKRPGVVIRELQRKLAATDGGREQVREEIHGLEKALVKMAEVETRNVRHLNEEVITREEFLTERKRIAEQRASAEQRLNVLQKMLTDMDASVQVLQGAESLLESLRAKTDRNPPFVVRREIAQALVDHITVESVPSQLTPKITVTYRFEPDFDRYRLGNRTVAKGKALHDTGIRTRRTWRLSAFSKPAENQF